MIKPRDIFQPLVLVSLCTAVATFVACTETSAPELPSPPENVAATLATKDRISITWTARPSRENVVAYGIYRDGLKIGESPTTSYTDSTAPQAQTHLYSVASHSGAGIISIASAAVSIFAPDATGPKVSSTVPAEGEVNVAPSAGVQIKFNEPIDAASLSSGAILVRDDRSGAIQPGAVAYNAATRAATWSPAPALPAEARISVTVTTQVKDSSGNALATPFSLSFTTREIVAPYIVEYSPPDGSIVPMGVWPTIRFSERLRLDFFGTTAGVRMIDYVGTANPIATSAPFDTLTNTVTVRPTKRIQSFHPYTVEVNNAAIDLAGNPIANRFEFQVQFGEWALPEIAAVSPADGATNVPLTGPVTVDFSAPLLPVNDYDMRVDVRVTASNQSIVSLWICCTNNRITIVTREREPNTNYTAIFYHFFTDSKGVRHEFTKQWTFTTGN